MARYCYQCGSGIGHEDVFCPYCSARQSKPGDPFIGFLLHHSLDILGVILGLLILTACMSSVLVWLF